MDIQPGDVLEMECVLTKRRAPAAPGGGRYSGWGWISACAAPAAAGR